MATTTSHPVPDPAYAEANRDVVRRVVTRLAATGLLTGGPEPDPDTVRAEAEKVRDFLNMEIPNVSGGGLLDDSFKRMRRSARDFVRAAGPAAATFRTDPAYFAACLEAMRLTLRDEVNGLTQGFVVAS